jgi:hypothetical protein
MMVEVPVVGKVGDCLTSYFRDFGKFDGRICDTMVGGFLLELEMTGSMRQKFASKLTWLERKQKNPGIRDIRKDARIIPESAHSFLTLMDDSTMGASSSTCRSPVSRSPHIARSPQRPGFLATVAREQELLPPT